MKEAEAEELETGAETTETSEPVEGASEGQQGTEAKKASTQAAKKEDDLIDEAAKDIEKRIGTIKTKHDGLVQQGDVFTTSLGRTPGGRGRDRGVARDNF